tara:strand:- start:25 stop:465 length:441 start_codon:yes stop_codon:yes gene_type:complete
MSVGFTVTNNQESLNSKIESLKLEIENYKTYLLQGLADSLTSNSTVDTGNFVNSYRVSSTAITGSTTAEGKPKGQDRLAQQGLGRDRLYADINSLQSPALTRAVFTNIAYYAEKAEYSPRGNSPFTTTRNKANVISDEALARAKAT